MGLFLKLFNLKRTNCLLILGLLLVGVYYPILQNQLLDYWDDQWVVMNWYTEGGIAFNNLWRILTEFYHGQYAPFNQFLYLILYNIDGYNPFLFHLSSLILHIVNTWMVYLLIRKLLYLQGKIDIKIIIAISFLTALIFGVHPLNVESVAWMSASKVLVYGVFYLIASYTFLVFIETSKKRYFLYTLMFYVFSFLGKEQAVVFPIWMLLMYWFIGGKLNDRKIWILILPFLILSLIFGLITIFSQYADGGGFLSGQGNYPLWQRMVFACYAFFEYLFKIIFPFNLSYLYPFPNAIGDPLPTWMLLYPAILILVLVSLSGIIRLWPISFGLLFFTIHIGISLHIIPISRFVIVADRYAYIAIIGIGFIISYYGVLLLSKIKLHKFRIIMLSLFSGYILYLGAYANHRTYTWYDTDTLKHEFRNLLDQRKDDSIFKIDISDW